MTLPSRKQQDETGRKQRGGGKLGNVIGESVVSLLNLQGNRLTCNKQQ